MSVEPTAVELAAVGDLLARLLLFELDREEIVRLRQPERAAALAAVGLALPEGEPETLAEGLAADYFDRFIGGPRGRPLVLSLWEEGRYDAAAAAELRRLTEELGFEFSADSARGAPPDHLGSILLLHGELLRRGFPELSAFRRRFLAWAPAALGSSGRGPGFYDKLLGCTLDYLDLLGSELS